NVARDLATLLNGKVQDPGVGILRGGGDLAKIIPDRPIAKIEPVAATTADNFQVEAKQLSNSLVNASATARPGVLAQLRDTKGGVYTEALALAIPRLSGEAKLQARDALAKRLTRMTAKTLHGMLKDENREVRRGAVIACGCKEDKQFINDLIELLADADALICVAAHESLRTLSGQDFGPNSTSILDKENAILAWKNWWKVQSK
ncbi:MAG: hypothetical protein K8T89_02865, partial [Planctomycetes bacterium]|nr:hypothetical protein [Planctomycetota bacterium]